MACRERGVSLLRERNWNGLALYGVILEWRSRVLVMQEKEWRWDQEEEREENNELCVLREPELLLGSLAS